MADVVEFKRPERPESPMVCAECGSTTTALFWAGGNCEVKCSCGQRVGQLFNRPEAPASISREEIAKLVEEVRKAEAGWGKHDGWEEETFDLLRRMSAILERLGKGGGDG